MSKTVAIAGLGWLGKPFAQRLELLGYTVKGTVTTLEKATQFQQSGLDVYPIEISESGITGPIETFLSNIDYLAIMIPPGLRRNTGANYVLKMQHLIRAVSASEVIKIILVSSTSVYDDSQGIITEVDEPTPKTEAGKQLLAVEKLFLEEANLEATVVRFGGLLGGSRQPVRYLAGRENLSDGNAPVNLIHRDDCIAILSEIIKNEAFGHVFNAVSPNHPSKKEYYSQKAIELNLIPPTFSEENSNQVHKEVNSVNLKKILSYSFKGQL